MNENETDTGSFYRRAALLTGANLLSQALAAATQILLVFWLTPSSFGQWAAATSATALIVGLANLGEVNGYLVIRNRDLASTIRSTLKINTALALAGISVAAAIGLLSDPFVGLLAFGCSLNIPLQGLANLMNAAHIKSRLSAGIIWGQLAAGLFRLGASVALAATTRSALALLVGMLIFNTVSIVALMRGFTFERGAIQPPRPRERVMWSLPSFAQMFASQSDYLTLAAIAPHEALGIYYVAYQLTVALLAISSTVLSRMGMSEFSRAPNDEKRRALLRSILRLGMPLSCIVFGAGVLVLYLSAGYLPGRWDPAIPLSITLASSLPARLMAPLCDALQMSRGKWVLVAKLAFIEGVGNTLACLLYTVSGLTAAAIAVAAWNAMIGCTRLFLAIGLSQWRDACTPAGWLLAFLGCIVAGQAAGHLLIGIGIILAGSCIYILRVLLAGRSFGGE